MTAQWVQGFLCCDEHVWNYIEVMVVQCCECAKCHGIVYFQKVNFFIVSTISQYIHLTP